MTDFYWHTGARTKHLYIPGTSGYGKTSLMANLALDDLEFQKGPLIIIDPKGSSEGLVERVLPHIPPGLVHKTIYLSQDHPIPIDMLSFRDQREKNFIRGDIITILQRFCSYGSWGPTMQGTLNHLIPTLLEAEDATFLDIGRFLESEARREEILEQVSKERRAYWHEKENRPSKSDIGPIATRMSNFYEPPLSAIVGGRRGEGLNIADVIDKNQILLVDTSPPTPDGLMLGALVMSRIQQAIFRRKPGHDHPICHVYADEFQNFVTSAFNVMLSQARSYGLSLCLANQHPKQITDVWDDITGNVSSYVIFRMDGNHAAMLKSKIGPVVGTLDELESERETRERKDKIRRLTAAMSHSEKFIQDIQDSEDEFQPDAYEDLLTTARQNVAHRRRSIGVLEDLQFLKGKEASRTYLDEIPRLPVGGAIYISQSGATYKVRTPAPPIPPEETCVEAIIAHSATYGAKRIVAKTAGIDAATVVHSKGDVPTGPDNAPDPTLLRKPLTKDRP